MCFSFQCLLHPLGHVKLFLNKRKKENNAYVSTGISKKLTTGEPINIEILTPWIVFLSLLMQVQESKMALGCQIHSPPIFTRVSSTYVWHAAAVCANSLPVGMESALYEKLSPKTSCIKTKDAAKQRKKDGIHTTSENNVRSFCRTGVLPNVGLTVFWLEFHKKD